MKTDVIVLGINDGHNAGAALVRNGEVVAAIQEERLANVKNYSGVPRRAIPEVFRISGVHPHDVDLVALVSLNRVYAPLAEQPWKLRLFETISPFVASHAWSRLYVWLLSRRRRMEGLRKVLRAMELEGKELMVVEHHLAHAATAFYPRPWDDPTLVLTADGAGDGVSSTVNVGDGLGMKRVASSTYYDSIGNGFYSEITAYLGMKRWEHEYKCVTGDTPILMGSGEVRSIEDLFQEVAQDSAASDADETVLDCALPVMALDRGELEIVPGTATKVYRKRTRGTLYEVRTASGRRVRVTPTHRFHVLRNGVLEEVRAKDLWEGASLAIPRQLTVPGESVPKQEDWASFFGLFLSEGWEDFRPEKSTSLFYFANQSGQLHHRFGDACERLFGKRPTQVQYDGVPLSRIALLPQRNRLSAMGYRRALARGKRVPAAIMRMDAEGTSEFLRTYYEGDGGVSLNKGGGHALVVSTASDGMASDLSYLLLRHGLVARLGHYRGRATNSPKRKVSNYWYVKVFGSDAMGRFAKRVGFLRERNRRRLAQASDYNPRTKTNTIPCAALVRDLYRDGKIPLPLYLRYYHDCRISGRMSRGKLRRFLAEVETPDLRIEFMRKLAYGDLFWDPVREVRPIPFDGYVYDLYVPDHHTFVGGFGGVILHNTMGLAPYGRPEYCLDVMRSLIRVNPRRPLEFENTSGKCGTRVQKILRRKLVGERFDNIAAACQQRFEELMTQWIGNAIAETGLHRVACAGGLFLNVKANKRIRELPEVEEAFFYPAADDGGTPVGAALEAYARYCARDGRTAERVPVGPVYYGHAYDDEAVAAALRREGSTLRAERVDGVDATLGEMVARGKIVARFAGADEWGPRALGNRSILADPRDLRVVQRLNAAIKMRDFWMPFAPAILEERMGEYLVDAHRAPYMIEAFDTRGPAEELVAALHPRDGTARPQTVNSWNGGYREALESFQEETGVGGVVNTSFNLHGHPIVGTPDAALWTFKNSQLDALALGSYLVERP